MVDIIALIKQIQGVDKVQWSEEVYRVSTHKENVMKSFQKYWNNSNNNHSSYVKSYNNNNNSSRKK